MRRLLSLLAPAGYELAQACLGGKRARRSIIEDYIRPSVGESLLDFGCGTAAIRPLLGQVEYTGVEKDRLRSEYAKTICPGDRIFQGGIETLRELPDGAFDRIMAVGVLHHMTDCEAGALLSSCGRLLKQGGTIVTVDPVFEENQARIAKLLAGLDPGGHVRTAEAYADLVPPCIELQRREIRRDLMRVPYTHFIMVCGAA